jgi:hypothetical protein
MKIKKDIEKLREELYLLLLYKDLTDNKVVKCSQKLDKLLVKYEHTKQSKKILNGKHSIIKIPH